ncbi:hypothetical protein CDL15_Pgr008625 [Punica granatum]|uniref:Pentatricopeptide repeat-containing protein n=1 Tax=Punica granatum TaxID=22663 RepID=A0A218WQ08_PUNGR|nr:hypothetical protein CDL15_Pgr008625 [Punica granatum]
MQAARQRPKLCTFAGMLEGLCPMKEIDRGVQPDVLTFNTVINRFSYAGHMAEACQLFDEMEERGYDPNASTYNITMVRGLINKVVKIACDNAIS